MESKLPPVALESALDLGQILSTGSLLQINEDYGENSSEFDINLQNDSTSKNVHYIGEPIKSFEKLEKQLKDVDKYGFVKKKVLEEGGGKEIDDGCTVSLVFSGFWEADENPFDVRKMEKPLVVDLKENGLLPGLYIAVKSMLVGELSIFLLSYQVMYGEMGVPPRIKPKADCVFYIKLIKSIITPEEGDKDSSDPNTFNQIHHRVKVLYSSGLTLYKVNNYFGTIQLLRKCIYILHNCRLADERDQCVQEKLLIKVYMNLAICYNKVKQPLKTCTVCNELNRLGSLWNNVKALFQNAKALRMIGQFGDAKKKLKRAMKLCPGDEEMIAEYELLETMQKSYDGNKLVFESHAFELVSDSFKQEVNNLVKNFKESTELCKFILPSKLNNAETEYIKEVCIRENLFFNRVEQNFLLDKEDEIDSNVNC